MEWNMARTWTIGSFKAATKRVVPRGILQAMNQCAGWLKRQGGTCRARFARPNLFSLASNERIGIVYMARTHLSTAERLLLYTMVRGLRPERVLEIGSAYGGSASIMACAMEDNGAGL